MSTAEDELVTTDNRNRKPPVIRELSIADRRYSLIRRRCVKCDEWHYEIHRFAGVSFSCYRMAEAFEEELFENFVENIDDMLLQSAADLIQDYHQSLTEKNCEHGIEADGSFAFRLLEYGRHRISKLSKLRMLDILISHEPAKSDQEEAIRLAFELGMATAEHRLLTIYEDYVLDGMAMSEWREAGLPSARAERLRQGQTTHAAVVNAAKAFYRKESALIRNDSETARRIVALRLPDLQKGRGCSVGVDAITRHIRQARSSNEL